LRNESVPALRGPGVRVADIAEDREPAQTRDHLAQEFKPLAGYIGGLEREAGDVAARPGQARHHA